MEKRLKSKSVFSKEAFQRMLPAGKKDTPPRVEVYDCQIGRFKELLEEYHSKLKALNVNEEDKMAAVQMALDLTYIKEELDEVCQNMDPDALRKVNESVQGAISQIKESLENLPQNHDPELLSQLQQLDDRQKDLLIRIVNLDHTVGEPIKRELEETREQLAANQERLEGKVDKSMGMLKGMLFVSLLLNLAAAGGIIYFLLIQLNVL
ncbi:MAG: hypothetical protein PUB10_05710 [Clostridiales bacterium]|nr:hypothetical protein [Clostridiales bacterium]